ncbi:MAG: hypothetical protein KDA21_08550, partial [Phycisphaerales bacterium]|nr:hypothetical protein [Phycisphaerales bacterium]
MTPQIRMRPGCRLRRLMPHAALLGAVVALSACRSKPVSYVAGNDPWTGPPMTLGTTATVQTATFQVPTAGWTAHLDYTETRFGRSDFDAYGNPLETDES